jgi:hypothetical protein
MLLAQISIERHDRRGLFGDEGTRIVMALVARVGALPR